MGYKMVGNAIAEWDEKSPFIFLLTEEEGPTNLLHEVSLRIDLTELSHVFTDSFILQLKDLLIEWRKKISIKSIANYSRQLRYLFSHIHQKNLFTEKVNIIDESFLLVLSTIKNEIEARQLYCLRRAFMFAPHAPIWCSGIQARDFPKPKEKKGMYGLQIDRILSKALSRA